MLIPHNMKCWSSLSTDANKLVTVPAELLVRVLGAAEKAGSRATPASAATVTLGSALDGKRKPAREQIKTAL